MENLPQPSEDFQNSTARSYMKALRLKQVIDKTGLSRTHTYRLIAQGDHPKPIQLSDRVFVWNEADIDAWLEAKFLEASS